MKILVIGGTRFFGLRIVEKLLDRGDDVTVYSRGRSRPAILEHVAHIEGDRDDEEGFRRAFGSLEFDVVIDNIAFTAEHGRTAYNLFRGRAGQYLVCSSVSVYKDVPRYRVLYEDEVDLTRRTGESYGDGKRALEHGLWKNLFEDLPITIFRPTVVEGPRDPAMHAWYYLQRFLDGGPVLLPRGIPDILLRIVYADDVADAFIAAIANHAAHNRVYNLGGEEVFTLLDYADMVRTAAGSDSDIVECPMADIRKAPGLSDFSPGYLGFDSIPDIGAARRDLGYRPDPVQSRVRETVEWIRALESRPDSRGYESRDAEIEFARNLAQARTGGRASPNGH